MGAGIYLVWPAFYTDVTDAYRLPRRARLRTDLGGIYFNAVVAVVTLGGLARARVDALLLLIALQMLEIVKNLSPVIRADGYHILADATGVPDLYAHIGPTLKRLLPWSRREPSALKGWARTLVTVWVLVIVPILLGDGLQRDPAVPEARGLRVGERLEPDLRDARPGRVRRARVVVRLFALALPVLGVALIGVRMVRSMGKKAWGWSDGRPPRQAVVLAGATGLVALLAWAWWPSGQYQPVRATDDGTLVGAFAPSARRPPRPARSGVAPVPPRLAPGRHLAVALIPRGGPTEGAPGAVGRQRADGDKPTVLVSPDAPEHPQCTGGRRSGVRRGSRRRVPTDAATAPPAGHAAAAPTQPATQLPFKLPDKPGEGDSQALATNTTDGGIVYDVAYSLVTVSDGAAVENKNGPTRSPAARRAPRWPSRSSSCWSSARATGSCRSTSPRRSTSTARSASRPRSPSSS